jgi:phage terminase Nu1 subunit (DNA packaging protein)
MATINGDRLSEALNITIRRIQQLVQEGMPQVARNRYDLGQCYYWHVRYLQKALVRRENTESTSPMQSFRERMLRAQTEREEMDLFRARGQLIPVAAYESHMAGIIIAARTRLLQLAVRLAALVVSLVDPTDRAAVKRLLDDEIRSTLADLGANGHSSIPGNGGDAARSTVASVEPMGGPAAPAHLGVGERKPNHSGRSE